MEKKGFCRFFKGLELESIIRVVILCILSWGTYSGYMGKKLNQFIAQTIVWHYGETRRISVLEAHEKHEEKEIANLKLEIIEERYT